VVDANPQSKDWKSDVRAAAMNAFHGQPFANAITLHLVFFVPRPKCHFRSGKNSHLKKDSAPQYPTTKPDATKLLRGVEDALTGIIWRDDAQIVTQFVTKRYGDTPGVQVNVREGS
jgi:Holliday junction resolvase RusA-like endonuclease